MPPAIPRRCLRFLRPPAGLIGRLGFCGKLLLHRVEAVTQRVGAGALRGVALSMATDRRGGFVAADMETVSHILPALSLVAYRIGLSRSAAEALGRSMRIRSIQSPGSSAASNSNGCEQLMP
jgi:hypothetical protein